MNKLESMSFRKDFVLPVEEQDRMLGFIKWGKKNDYPYFLVDLFNGSAWHQGIIKNKTYYIAGGGIEVVSGELSRFLANSYTDFTMDEIVEQLAFDYELFGSFAVKGTWNKEGTRVAMWEHLPVDAIRISSDERMYYLSDDWTVQQQSAEKTNLRTLPALDETNKTGSFVLYYKDPAKKARKEHGVYPKPPYQGGITAIQTDCDISKFHMYELQNGFKSGTMITFMDGFPETQEEAESFKNQIKGPASSIENSGDIIITFAPSADQAPKVENLTGNDLDKRYDMLQSSVQQNILVAHSVVAPSLFGVAPEGSFNAAESAELFEIFKKTYVDTRQKRIEWILNYMIQLSGDIGTVKLKDVKPIGVADNAPVAAPVAQESSFNRQDINALIDVVSKMNDGKISSESALTIIMTTYPHIDEAQARKIVGINTNIQQSHNCQFNNDVDEIGFFAEHGDPANNFDTVMTISIPWNTPMDEVFKKHDELFAAIGQVTVSGEGSKGLGKTEGGSQFEVRYSYRTIPGIPPVKTESRAFCVRLLQLNRLYTRDEIQTISIKIGRDVWKYRGGWYTNPETKKTTPWCRHEWVQQLVIAKGASKDVEIVQPEVKTNEIKIATVKDGKLVAVETFEKNTDIKISKVKMSKDMTVEKLQKYLTELNKLTTEYRIENSLNDQIELGFQSTSKTYGFVRSTFLDSKIVQINLGHRTDLTSRNPNKRALVDENGRLKLQHKSSVDQDNIEVATVTHEMGHVFALNQSRNPKIQNYFSKLREIYREYNDEVFLAKQKVDVKTLEKIYLGQYAQTNLNEFHAEAFTEYRLNSNPSLYAKKVGKLFDSMFKK